MSILSGVSDFFGLDIGVTDIRLVQLQGTGATKTLSKYAFTPVDSKLSLSDAPADQQKLVQLVRELVATAGITTKNVAVGVPSAKVFTTVADIDRLPPGELAKTIRYQVDAMIPTPLDESKVDWAVLGDSPTDKSQVEILLSSVSNTFIENRLDALESIGLNVISFEPNSMALARAVVASDSMTAQMVLDIGSKSTDLVIVLNGAPRLTRSIPTGVEAIVRGAMQNLNIDEQQAQQFVFKFGLSKDKLEGQVLQSIVGTIESLMGEIDKSIKFFQTRYVATKLDRIIVMGGAATLPELPLYIATKFGINVEVGNAWRNISFPANRQTELLALSSSFAVAAGLAERSE